MNHDPPATDVFSMPHQAPSGGFSDSDGWITVTDQPVPRIKGYELHEAIGRGGMGIVYRATHLESTKPVALKLMINSPVGLAMRARRFQTEGAIERLLDHPNIVQVVDVGECRGWAYIAMELVDGPDLANRLLSGPLDPRESARIASGIAAAIHHAHQAGVIHRDLKPANILIAPDGTPKVTDFGLAKVQAPANCNYGQTASGVMIGTLGYMAPEQMLGNGAGFSPAVDIYGLGCLLYEMLTGRRLCQAKTVAEALRMAEDDDPAPPRDLNPLIHPLLDAICMKCLCKEPERRYHSAAELAEDLERFLSGQTVRTRGSNILKRLVIGLYRSPHPEEYRSWHKLLVWLAFQNLVTQSVLFAFRVADLPLLYDSPVRAIQLVLMWLTLWRFGGFAPRTASVSQRQVAANFVGFLIACSACSVGNWLRGETIADPAMYVEWSTLSGFLFVVYGRQQWGWFYAFAGCFFVLGALAAPLNPATVMLFGLLWAGALLAAARRIEQTLLSSPPAVIGSVELTSRKNG
jgi:serine/threonine protein kinase